MDKEHLLNFIDNRILNMLKRPLMWAGTLESLELQFLTLMEIREQIVDKTVFMKDKWISFFHKKYPGYGPIYLNSILDKLGEKEDKMVALMSEFYQENKGLKNE